MTAQTTTDLASLLESAFNGAKKVAILGCGSLLRGDDAAGTEIALRLADLSGRARVFAGHVAPENLTGEIKAFAPDLVLILDAVDFGGQQGDTRMIEIAEIAGVSFSTHMLPLKIIVEYLRQEIGAEIKILGIQPAGLEFMTDLSPQVSATVSSLSELLRILLA